VRPGRKVKKRALTIQSPLSVGLFSGKWCSFSATPDMPHDQREEDGGALVFQSVKLDEPIEILGAVRVELEIASDQPVAMVCARLSSVAPNDKATRVTYGVLNLTHRDSHENPAAMIDGETYRVTVRMNEIAQSIPAGHRLRLSLSTSYWPIVWPPPRPTRLTVHTAESFIHIPVRAPQSSDETLRQLGPAEPEPHLPVTVIEPRHYDWIVTRDLARDVSTLEVVKDEGRYRLEDVDIEIRSRTVERYSYRVDDFDSPRGETEAVRRLSREGWCIETRARTELTCSPEAFELHAELDAYEDGHRVFSKNYVETILRDHL
jgi:hypothetical protein